MAIDTSSIDHLCRTIRDRLASHAECPEGYRIDRTAKHPRHITKIFTPAFTIDFGLPNRDATDYERPFHIRISNPALELWFSTLPIIATKDHEQYKVAATGPNNLRDLVNFYGISWAVYKWLENNGPRR